MSHDRPRLKQGLIQVYTGDGKGKTTAALGLAMRAVGHGLKVIMVQFMKGRFNYGELKVAKYLPNFEIVSFGTPDFVDPSNIRDVDREEARKAMDFAKRVIESGDYDVVILDEINVAMDFGLVDVNEVINMLKNKPRHVEVVLTGRYAPREILEMADLVTIMRNVKHPYERGIIARRGIDF
ncbi:MAG: cob(I)yrinic acid a,c-diamide adenosyltransferase [Candidatus Baldrarchaeia archaeon]